MKQRLRGHRNPVRAVGGFLFLFVALAGCSASKQASEVTGKVTLNGNPLPGGKVTFVYKESGKGPSATLVHLDGRYTLVNLPSGDVSIAVEGEGKRSVVSKDAPPPVQVPARYAKAESSGLTFTVSNGKQTKDLELKSP